MHVDLAEHAEAARFAEIGGELSEQSVGADADAAGKAVLAIDALLDTASDRLRRTEETTAAGDVQECLVDGDGLNGVGELPVERQQTLADGSIGSHVDRQEDRLRTEALCLRDRHGRAHPAGARLVRAGGDHATLGHLAADYDGTSPQLRPPHLLHGSKESVHVDMEECRRRYEHMFVVYVPLRQPVKTLEK